jgi:hypothetical protein
MSDTRTEASEVAALSDRARAALMNTGTNREGARVPVSRNESMLWAELTEAGLIGPGGGLTRAGSIARERHTNRVMDELFPL